MQNTSKWIIFLRWLPALGLMGLIFLLSHQPGGDSGLLSKQVLDFFASIGLDLSSWLGERTAFLLIRKAAHFTEYFLLGTAVWWGFTPMENRNKRALIAWTIAVLYAASDEFHQLFIPGRTGNVGDVLIDSFGAGVAILLLWGWSRRKSVS